jgi:hypothetical protein
VKLVLVPFDVTFFLRQKDHVVQWWSLESSH